MAVFPPRKKRTRQHVIADLGVHHVVGFILEEGHTAQPMGSDYGYDLTMSTFDAEGYAEPGMVFFQMKAAESLLSVGSNYVFDLDVRDYHLWMNETIPVILVLYDAIRKRAFWLAIQPYFRANLDRQPKKGAKSVRVHVPRRQPVNRQAIAAMRQLMRESLRSVGEAR